MSVFRRGRSLFRHFERFVLCRSIVKRFRGGGFKAGTQFAKENTRENIISKWKVVGYEGFETALKNPKFADVAKVIGIYGVRIENPGDVEPGLREAFARKGAAVIDVITNPNALSLPPKISAVQVEGYAFTMGKLILSDEVEEIAKKSGRTSGT